MSTLTDRTSPDPSPDAVEKPAKLSPRLVFWFSFVAMFVVTGLWSVGNPLMASMDEHAHMIKAAAVVRGEFGADETNYDPGRGVVELPDLYSQVATFANCVAYQPEATAACQPELTGDLEAESLSMTSAARYNPVYYALVGLPTLFSNSELTIYLMRLVSALLASLMFALALRTIAEISRSQWLMMGAVVAITPTTIFLSSSINPQSTELAGALMVWVGVLALLRDPDPNLFVRRFGRITFATVLFVTSRGLSPLFLLLILLAALAVSPWKQFLAVVKDRRGWIYIAICGAATLYAVLWTRIAGSLPTGRPVMFPNRMGRDIILYTVNSTSTYIEGSIGVFGWLDTHIPLWNVLLCAATILIVIFFGFSLAGFREKLVMLVVAGAVLVLPIYAHYSEARYIDTFWQGRYILPLAFGVPILAGFVMIKPGRQIPDWINRRILAVVMLIVVVVQVSAYANNLHRYINGTSGGWFRVDARSWTPVMSPLLLVGLTIAGWIALGGIAAWGTGLRVREPVNDDSADVPALVQVGAPTTDAPDAPTEFVALPAFSTATAYQPSGPADPLVSGTQDIGVHNSSGDENAEPVSLVKPPENHNS